MSDLPSELFTILAVHGPTSHAVEEIVRVIERERIKAAAEVRELTELSDD